MRASHGRPSMRSLLRTRALPEKARIEALAHEAGEHLRLEVLAEVPVGDARLPVYGLALGSEDPARPAFGLFGGVHGIERIGTHVVLSFLESLVERLKWDSDARRTLRKCRLVSVPLVNPGGMWLRRRANPRGVDLMRNAPVKAEVRTPPLAGGQRISSRLPWYRGDPERLEPETDAVVRFVRRELFPSPTALSLDVHSGFGRIDRLWYPYGKTTRPIDGIQQVGALADLLDRTYPYHVYRIEQQSEAYTIEGDLWDHLYDLHRAERPDGLFLPWTLEIGSWQWVRKDPRQLFASGGVYNPLQPHRYGRAMRRHLLLLDFFLSCARNHERWTGRSSGDGA